MTNLLYFGIISGYQTVNLLDGKLVDWIMLDNNTNKVVWVGVAVGVVAVVGVAALALYPQAFSGMKDTITEKTQTFAGSKSSSSDTANSDSDETPSSTEPKAAQQALATALGSEFALTQDSDMGVAKDKVFKESDFAGLTSKSADKITSLVHDSNNLYHVTGTAWLAQAGHVVTSNDVIKPTATYDVGIVVRHNPRLGTGSDTKGHVALSIVNIKMTGQEVTALDSHTANIVKNTINGQTSWNKTWNGLSDANAKTNGWNYFATGQGVWPLDEYGEHKEAIVYEISSSQGSHIDVYSLSQIVQNLKA